MIYFQTTCIFLLLVRTAHSLQPFWLAIELTQVDWKDGCLTSGCSEPRFQGSVVCSILPTSTSVVNLSLMRQMAAAHCAVSRADSAQMCWNDVTKNDLQILADDSASKEKLSISWPVSDHFVQNVVRQWVPEWPTGDPDDISLSCQVIGTDPTYGFPRTCDQTASTRLFRRNSGSSLSRTRSQHDAEDGEDDSGKHILEIRAKCFNATLVVQRHTERCPWCPHPAEMTVIQQEIVEDNNGWSILASSVSHSPAVATVLLVLVIMAIAATVGFACLLISYIRQKRRFYKQMNCKQRYHAYKPTTVIGGSPRDEENRYDMPWEQSRPLTYWLGTNGTKPGAMSPGTTTTSPLDSASSLPYAYRVPPSLPPPQVTPSTRLYHTITNQPSKPLPHHQDDSGLESV